MEILQTRFFRNLVKKLHKNQKKILDKAIHKIIENPGVGQMKKGDLAGTQVYKFNMLTQLMLLAYIYHGD